MCAHMYLQLKSNSNPLIRQTLFNTQISPKFFLTFFQYSPSNCTRCSTSNSSICFCFGVLIGGIQDWCLNSSLNSLSHLVKLFILLNSTLWVPELNCKLPFYIMKVFLQNTLPDSWLKIFCSVVCFSSNSKDLPSDKYYPTLYSYFPPAINYFK